tara:strand:- start:2196 stop:3080 length:885 start_codon:yes stop_codon:yes gene_type:complete
MNNEIDSSDIYTINSDPNRDLDKDSLTNLHQFVIDNWPTIPSKELLQRSVIENQSIASVTAFLSTTSNSKNLFRKAPSSNDIQSEIWLSIVQKEAFELERIIDFPNFSPDLITDDLIAHLRNLTNKPEYLVKVNSALQSIGIVLIYERTLNSSLVDGAVGKTISGRPYIGMSLRHNRLDNYWFTLFHELGHLALHFDVLDIPILDSEDITIDSDIEIEADIFAKNNLIPREIWNRSPLKFGKYNKSEEIFAFARKVEIHPAIVAGRVRRERNDYSIHTKIVSEFNTRKILWGIE